MDISERHEGEVGDDGNEEEGSVEIVLLAKGTGKYTAS